MILRKVLISLLLPIAIWATNIYNQPGAANIHYTVVNNTFSYLSSFMAPLQLGLSTDLLLLCYKDQSGNIYKAIKDAGIGSGASGDSIFLNRGIKANGFSGHLYGIADSATDASLIGGLSASAFMLSTVTHYNWDSISTRALYVKDTAIFNGNMLCYSGANVRTGPGSSGFTLQTTAGLSRWIIRLLNTETSNDTGSDFTIISRHDDGSALAVPLTIKRSTGLVTVSKGLTVTGGTKSDSLNADTIHARVATIGIIHGLADSATRSDSANDAGKFAGLSASAFMLSTVTHYNWDSISTRTEYLTGSMGIGIQPFGARELSVYNGGLAGVAKFLQSASSAILPAVEVVSAGKSALDVAQWEIGSGYWIQRWYDNTSRTFGDTASITGVPQFTAGIRADGKMFLGDSLGLTSRLTVAGGLKSNDSIIGDSANFRALHTKKAFVDSTIYFGLTSDSVNLRDSSGYMLLHGGAGSGIRIGSAGQLWGGYLNASYFVASPIFMGTKAIVDVDSVHAAKDIYTIQDATLGTNPKDSITGFHGATITDSTHIKKVGHTVFVWYNISSLNDSGSVDSVSIHLPYATNNNGTVYGSGWCVNDNFTTPCMIMIRKGGNIAFLEYYNATTGVVSYSWGTGTPTARKTKSVCGQFFYEAAN